MQKTLQCLVLLLLYCYSIVTLSLSLFSDYALMNQQKRVFVFKGKGAQDDYDRQLEAYGYHQHFIPVLGHALASLDVLIDIITRGPCYSGLVITSQRAVEALQLAIESAGPSYARVKEAWTHLPVFVVGPQTLKALQSLGLGEDSTITAVADKAVDLCPVIVSRVTRLHPLLFLAGDKRRDLLPVEMTKANVVMEEVCVYATCEHPKLRAHLDSLEAPCGEDWSVYFSPSGVDYVLQAASFNTATTKIAAIGTTTAEHLRERGFRVDVVADRPDAVHLVQAIHHYDTQQPPNTP
ncbi:tetrapyrrole biosynthesis, uroporphyrinogen III synthase [Spinellus fusiger]|nr:tetrapyrrole biosynthesis, uroporphyrinogen III synthase [Spinellus fusiger]